MLDLRTLMDSLARSRPIFHSEADFQHALAWQIHTENPNARVRLEFRPFATERLYVDIWCEIEGWITAIELKYPTRRFSTTHNGEAFSISNQGAQDLIRYDFIKDIVRLERMAQSFQQISTAAIILTNDPLYWSVPTQDRFTIDAAFRIHQGVELSGPRAWHESAGQGTTKTRMSILNLTGSYAMKWRDFSSFDEGHVSFRFSIIEP